MLFIASIMTIMSYCYSYANENRIIKTDIYNEYLDYNIYFLPLYEIESCVENPVLENFDNICNDKVMYVRELFNIGSLRSWRTKDGYESNAGELHWTRGISFNALKFMENNDNLNEFLRKNNIEGNVSESALLIFTWNDFDTFPKTIWIKTTKDEIYYIVADDELDDDSNIFFHPTEFKENGKLYNEEAFKSKYLWHDGNLYINGKLVEDSPNPIFMSGTCRIPIRTVLEGLGYKVDYDAKNDAILVEKNNKKYAFLLRTYEYVTDYPENVVQIICHGYLYDRNDRIYISAIGGLAEFFDGLGYEKRNCDIDYINRNYFINIEN